MNELKTRSQVFNFITSVLGTKYLNKDRTAPLVDTPEGLKLGQRTLSIINKAALKKDYSTLIWAGPNEGLSLRHGRALCQLIKGPDFKPLLITSCNGATAYAADEDFFEINPCMFPRHEFDWVSIISGCVNVSNFLSNGEHHSLGSANVVRYAIGQAAEAAMNPWEASEMFPRLDVITIEGDHPCTTLSGSDSEQEEHSISPASPIFVCQNKKVDQLTTIIRKNSYATSVERLRTNPGGRWATIQYKPSGKRTDELKTLLDARHIFKTTTSEICRSTKSPGVGLLHVAEARRTRKITLQRWIC